MWCLNTLNVHWLYYWIIIISAFVPIEIFDFVLIEFFYLLYIMIVVRFLGILLSRVNVQCLLVDLALFLCLWIYVMEKYFLYKGKYPKAVLVWDSQFRI